MSDGYTFDLYHSMTRVQKFLSEYKIALDTGDFSVVDQMSLDQREQTARYLVQ